MKTDLASLLRNLRRHQGGTGHDLTLQPGNPQLRLGAGSASRRAGFRRHATLMALSAGALGMLGTTGVRADNHEWVGNGLTGNWSESANWLNNDVPDVNETAPVIINFPVVLLGNSTTVMNIPGLVVDELRSKGASATIHSGNGAKLTLRGTAESIFANGSLTLESTLEVVLANADLDFYVGSGRTVTIKGRISGGRGAGFIKRGLGTLELGGTLANTYPGITSVNEGLMRLNKSTGPAVPGQLRVGSGATPDGDVVRLLQDNQIGTATVTVFESGLLDLNGFDQTVGALVLRGGHVKTAAGALTIGESLDTEASIQTAVIDGKLTLNGASKTFTVADGPATPDLNVNAVISVGGGISLGAGLEKDGPGVLRLNADNTYNGHTRVKAGVLTVANAGALGTSGGGGIGINPDTSVADGASLRLEGVFVSGERVTLSGYGVAGTGALASFPAGVSTWQGPVVLDGDCSIAAALNAPLTISGVVSGTGGLTKVGPAVVTLSGVGANTYAGTTTVASGRLVLSKPGGTVAVPHALRVGDDLDAGLDEVFLLNENQVASDAPVYIASTGKFSADNFNQAIGSLEMNGGELSSALGLVTLQGNVSIRTNVPKTSVISGKLSLGGAVRVFDMPNNPPVSPELLISAAIIGGNGGVAGVDKTGRGELELAGVNTYLGPTTVSGGILTVSNSKGLGGTQNGTIVHSLASLVLEADVDAEPLQLHAPGAAPYFSLSVFSGIRRWGGPIELAEDSAVTAASGGAKLTLSGVVSGAGGLTKWGPGVLEIGGDAANTYAGATFFRAGTVNLSKKSQSPVVAVPGNLEIGGGVGPATVKLFEPDQIADSCSLNMASLGLLDLTGLSDRVGSLAGSGTVRAGLGSLTFGAKNQASTTFNGVFEGIGVSLTKEGFGRFTVGGASTATGNFQVLAGELMVNGDLAGMRIVLQGGGILSGMGQVGNVAAAVGSVSPGGSPGQISVKDLDVKQSSFLKFEINGPIPGLNQDQINANGEVTLANAGLSVVLGYAPTNGHFVLIQNDGIDPVQGTFFGMPNGKTVYFGSTPFQIKYDGGDGNDVELVQLGDTVHPQLEGIELLPDGKTQITGSGLPFTFYQVERSADFVNWTVLGYLQGDANGNFSFTDPDGMQLPQAFYRFGVAAGLGEE